MAAQLPDMAATLTPGFNRPTPIMTGPAASSPFGVGNCAAGMNMSKPMK